MTGAGRLDWSTLISLSSKRAETFVPAPLDNRVYFMDWGLTKRVRRSEDPHSSGATLWLRLPIIAGLNRLVIWS